MMKKTIVFLIMSLMFVGSVNAESYYKNANGVELSKDEYDYLVELYSPQYLERFTQEQYDFLVENDIIGQEIHHFESDDKSTAYATARSYIYETSYKKLEGSYACGSICSLYAQLTWKILPGYRSYDHFGILGTGISSPYGVSSYMYYGSNLSQALEYKLQSNAASGLFKLPTNCSSLVLDFSVDLEKRGTVYVSYQHAQSNITKSTAKRFTFNYAGYGHVFLFDQPVRQHYDQMGGLMIPLS